MLVEVGAECEVKVSEFVFGKTSFDFGGRRDTKWHKLQQFPHESYEFDKESRDLVTIFFNKPNFERCKRFSCHICCC